MTQLELPLGLHFDLDEDTYHADPALGSSAIKAIARNPVDWQWDRLFGEDRETPAKLLGSALHTRVLEGLDVFNDVYAVPPSKEDFDGLLVTVADLKGRCDELGIKYKVSWPKRAFIEALEAAKDDAPIWDQIEDEFKSWSIDMRSISHDQWKTVQIAAEWMQQHQMLGAVMQNGTFFNGAPEVSYIYEVDGIRLKLRLDYCYPNLIIDLKTYAPWESDRLDKQVVKTVMRHRYDLQAAAYLKGLEHARSQLEAGQLVVHGDEPYDGFVSKLLKSDRFDWYWVMVRSTGAPAPAVVELSSSSFVLSSARDQVERAIQTYREYRERFGEDMAWTPPAEIITLTDENFPAYFGL